jgi:hypothetical protein
VESFLEGLKERMDGMIREVEVKRDHRARVFSGFSIR